MEAAPNPPRRPRSVNAYTTFFAPASSLPLPRRTRCRFCCTWSESAWPLALRPQSGQRGFPPIWSANSRADCIACACEQILVQWRTSSCKSRKPRVRICNCCHSKASRGTRVRAQPDPLARNSRLRRVVRPVRMPQAAHGMHAAEPVLLQLELLVARPSSLAAGCRPQMRRSRSSASPRPTSTSSTACR